MKHQFIATAALAGMLASAAHGASIVQNYAEAKDAVGEDGFVIVLYPDGWNKKATSLGKAVINSPEVGKAAGAAMIMGVAIPNISTPEVQEARKAQLGPIKLDMGRAQSYPAVYLVEASGRTYSVIPAHEYRTPNKEKESVAAVAGMISARQAALKEQKALMGSVEAAKPEDKIRIVTEAVLKPGISRPDKVADLVKKIDPKNETGLADSLSFDWYKLVWQCVKDDWKAGLKRCEELIANPALTPQQKQLVYLCAMGVLRRNCGAEGLEKMRQYGREMRALDPESRWGKSYDGAMRLWDVRFSLESGWSPATLPAKDEPTECEGPWPIKSPGTYKITFKYTGGSHALLLSKVELYDGDKKVAEDAHQCTSGHRLVGNVYTFKVEAPLQNPRIVVTPNMGKNRNSSGNITVSKE